MSEFMTTEGTQPPLSALILSSWEEGLHRTRSARTRKEYKSFLKQTSSYFLTKFAEFGIKKLGLIEAGLSDPGFKQLLTTPTIIEGKKRPAFMDPSELDPRVLLKLAVELCGSPLETIKDANGKMVEGPGSNIPHLPTKALQDEWGSNTGLLQSLTIVFNAGGRKAHYEWARGQNMTVYAATMRFAVDHGLEDELRAWCDPRDPMTPDRLTGLKEGVQEYNVAVKKEIIQAQNAEKEKKKAGGPAAAMNDLTDKGGKVTVAKANAPAKRSAAAMTPSRRTKAEPK